MLVAAVVAVPAVDVEEAVAASVAVAAAAVGSVDVAAALADVVAALVDVVVLVAVAGASEVAVGAIRDLDCAPLNLQSRL